MPPRLFEADAAGVKDHAFAHKRKRRFLAAAVPRHDHNFGRAVRSLANAQKGPHPQLGQIILFKDFHLKPQFLHRRQPCGEIIGGQHIGRFIRQITGKKHTFGNGGHRGCGLGHLLGFRDHEFDRSDRFGRGSFMGFKRIAPQRQPQRNFIRPRHRASKDQQIITILYLGQLRPGLARILRGWACGPV